MRGEYIFLIFVLVFVVSSFIWMYFNSRLGKPMVVSTPPYTPYTPYNPSTSYSMAGGGKMAKYSPFKNTYSVVILMVIAFAIWNFYTKKNKESDME